MATLPHFNSELRITGPYLNKKQGRRFIHQKNVVTGKATSKTYAKYLMEVHLERELVGDETVDHIDRDRLNDVISNLRVIPRGQHTSDDNLRVVTIKTNCVWCSVSLERKPAQTRVRAKRKESGPFCSPVCRGKYGASVSHGGDKLPVQQSVQSEYYYITK